MMRMAHKREEIPLTPRQREIVTFVETRILDEGVPPTVREIGQRFGITSPGAVRNHLDALLRKGALRKVPGSHRGLRLIRPLESMRGAISSVAREEAAGDVGRS